MFMQFQNFTLWFSPAAVLPAQVGSFSDNTSYQENAALCPVPEEHPALEEEDPALEELK